MTVRPSVWLTDRWKEGKKRWNNQNIFPFWNGHLCCFVFDWQETQQMPFFFFFWIPRVFIKCERYNFLNGKWVFQKKKYSKKNFHCSSPQRRHRSLKVKIHSFPGKDLWKQFIYLWRPYFLGRGNQFFLEKTINGDKFFIKKN